MDQHEPNSTSIAIKTHDLCRYFDEGNGRRMVLDSLDLTVSRGECVALLGRSGSGKSTLLNLISGIDIPDRGRIVVDKMDLTGLAEKQRTLFRRRNIGFVYQFFNLIPTLTIEENLRLPLELNRLDVTAVDDYLAEVGLIDRRRAFPDQLSGGEQQRIAVARALVHGPEIILADEPIGNLDAESANSILRLLQRLTRERHKTMLLVTHSTEALTIADRVLRLENGRLSVAGDGVPP